MRDVAPELLEQIEADFDKLFESDSAIRSLREKLKKGVATYEDAQKFAIQVGNLLAKTFDKSLSSEVLPDGRFYYNIAERILNTTLKKNHELISDYAASVQNIVNQGIGIGIKAQKAELNQDRIDGIIDIVSGKRIYDDIKYMMKEPIVNYSQAVVDSTLRKNVEFQGKSGLTPKVTRRTTGKACKLCASLAGSYEYPDVPKNVYQRHQNCRCIVEYDPGNGRKQNVHTKQWNDEENLKKRKAVGLPTAEEMQVAKFKRTFEEIPENKVVNVMRKDSKKWLKSLSEEEIRCLQKYTLNEVKENPKFYERLNAMLRGELPEDETLRYYANIISNALKKSTLGENVICYRGIDSNYFINYKVGECLNFSQFISSSVRSSRVFNRPVKVVIYARKGTKGAAYIERISKKSKQREVLFDKDCNYKVLSNSKELIELEVL